MQPIVEECPELQTWYEVSLRKSLPRVRRKLLAIALSAPFARLFQRSVMVIAFCVETHQHQALSVNSERSKS